MVTCFQKQRDKAEIIQNIKNFTATFLGHLKQLKAKRRTDNNEPKKITEQDQTRSKREDSTPMKTQQRQGVVVGIAVAVL